MKTLLNRVADRLLGSVAPRVEAAAACSFYAAYYCYCSGGLAYRQIVYVCYNSDGSTDYIFYPCQPSGTC